MRTFRMLLLFLIALIPLCSLVHLDFRGQLETQHSAMAAPDEVSYLLMARHFLEGGGLSLQEAIGRDTFYPPGYPLLLALFAKLTGGTLTTFKAHVFNTLLLSLDTLLAYFLARRLFLALSNTGHRRFHLSPEASANVALLLAALFATNWHVLETSLFIMSEPAFMLVVFLWLLLTFRWQHWHIRPLPAAAVAALAVAAWSIRGAGITGVAATALFPILTWLYDAFIAVPRVRHCPKRRSAALLLVLVLPFAYQLTLTQLSPEKSLASAQDSANSYPRQLLNGLTDGNRLHFNSPAEYPAIAFSLLKLTVQHLNDFAANFVPWPRENPDMHFRDIAGKCIALLALTGWLFHALRLRRGPPALHFLNLFLALYVGLYLLWPFDFARFWSPIFPVMLAFAVDGMIRFLQVESPRVRLAVPVVLLSLLLVQAAEEDALQLGNYARRLNYVSDALADAARAIVRRSDPQKTIIAVMGGDDHFTLAWYLSQIAPATSASPYSFTHGYRVESPIPHLAARNGAGERADDMLLRLAAEARSTGSALFLFSYFPNQSSDVRDTLESVRKRAPGRDIKKIFQKEIIATVWRIQVDSPPPPPATRPAIPP